MSGDEDDEKTYKHDSGVVFIIDYGKNETPSYYYRRHWTRTIIETLVKLGNIEDPFIALINNVSKNNLCHNNYMSWKIGRLIPIIDG